MEIEGQANPTATPESTTTEEGTQTGLAPESGATKATEQPQGEGAGTAPEPARQMLTVMGTQIDASKVPPELLEKVKEWEKAYTQKTQMYSESAKKAEALDRLTKHPGFQKWYYEQMSGVSQTAKVQEDPLELTPEKQAELLSDPAKMRGYIESVTMNAINKVALPAAQQAQYEAKTLRRETEISRLAENHKDFDDLNNNGKIESVLQKYAAKGVDIDLEDAYWLAKRPFMESEALVKAHERVQAKTGASTLPPSGAPPAGVRVIPGKGMSMEDKLRIAAVAAMRGEKIQFDTTK